MPNIIVNGGQRLVGELTIQGSKNAALPILAATILNKGITRLKNCPNIIDVNNMILVLKELGCNVYSDGEYLVIDSSNITSTKVSEDCVNKMRSSTLFIGALLGRYKEVSISFPGGCKIGSRPINYHLEAFKKMNIEINSDIGNKTIICKTKEIIGRDINLEFPSVGATQNIILASVLASGTTRIYNSAKEPEVSELCNFLNKAGAKIHGMGTSRITIDGVKELQDVEYSLISDRIVAGTYMSAVMATYGDVVFRLAPKEHLESVITTLRKMGANINIGDDYCRISSSVRPKALKEVNTNPYPGLPTDMQSQLMSVLCLSDGKTIIKENIFELRFQNVDSLRRMGANINEINKKAVEVNGVKQLYGAHVSAKDLRGGAALIIAALAGEGKTIIENSTYIDRGYEDIILDLQSLGGKIIRSK